MSDITPCQSEISLFRTTSPHKDVIQFPSPDLNQTPLAAFLRFLPNAMRDPRCARQKSKKAVWGVDLNQDYQFPAFWLADNQCVDDRWSIFRNESQRFPWMYGTHPWDLGNPLQSHDVCYDPKKRPTFPQFTLFPNFMLEWSCDHWSAGSPGCPDSPCRRSTV